MSGTQNGKWGSTGTLLFYQALLLNFQIAQGGTII